jgi:actin-related protein 5
MEQATVERIKTKKRLASELADRRSHASQLRMRSIANLASDTPASKRRKRGTEGNFSFLEPSVGQCR